MSNRVRGKDFVIEVSTVVVSSQPTPLGKHEPPKMTISLPRVRFLDGAGQTPLASKRPKRRAK